MDVVNFILLVINFILLVHSTVRDGKEYILNAVAIVILSAALSSSYVISKMTTHIDSKFEQMENSQ